MQGSAMALCLEHARPALALGLPEITAEAVAAVEIEPGQRFAVTRGVAVVPVRGILTPNMTVLERWFGWATYAGVAATMAELAANEDVAAIVMVMDTPGGMVLGIERAAEAIAAAAKVKPVHALVQHMALSAGYWLASQASDITLTPGSWVGSIGVALTIGASVQPGASGVQYFDFTSSHARAKWPDPTTDQGRAELQRELDASEAEFHRAVSMGRSIPMADLAARLSVTDDPADGGAVFWGADAVTRGLADRREDDSAFWDRMARTYSPKPRKTARSARVALAAARAAQAYATL
jgi:ClpP class serine protease